MFLLFKTATAEEEEKVVSGKKSSDISSSMIEIAYNPTLVPMDLNDFSYNFKEIEDEEDDEEIEEIFFSVLLL